MKSLGIFVLGLIVGAGALGVVAYNSAASMMLVEMESPYSLEESIAKIKEGAKKINKREGTMWVSPDVKSLHKSIKKHGGADVAPVMLVDLCEPTHATRILTEDDARIVSVMMPCTISVYEKSDGKVYIAHMNAGLMGGMFGGIVAEVMGEVNGQQHEILGFAEQ
ncbi:MAG: DUF302 domain-containing protein [Pseudomonadota bacterium]|nr:DUF302 domain-containing protein [Pseudomonadota bacterium]